MKQHQPRPLHLARFSFVLCCLSPMAAVLAQTSEQANNTYPAVVVKDTVLEYRQFEKVEITGSAILAKEAKQALPIQVISRLEIERSGATELSQLIQRLPLMRNYLEQGLVTGTNNGGPQTAAIHGNQSGTLILLNGRRLAYYGSQTIAGERAVVDLSFIPLAAIEKIEILTDGASSRYGSDAVAGVVNVITKTQVQGVTVNVEKLLPQGGAGQGQSAGFSWGKGKLERDGYSVRTHFSAQKREMLQAQDNTGTQEGMRVMDVNGQAWFFNTYYKNYSPTGQNYRDVTGKIHNVYFDANGVCAPGWYEWKRGQCAINNHLGTTIYPRTDSQLFYGQAEKLLPNQWVAFAEAQIGQQSQTFHPIGSPNFNIDQPNADGTRTYLVEGQPWGMLQQRYDNAMHHVVVGLKGEAAGWDFTSSLTSGRHSVHRVYDGGMVVSGYNTVRLKPEEIGLDPSKYSAETLAQFETYRRKDDRVLDHGQTRLRTLGLLGSRELMETDNGPVMLGVGLDGRQESVHYAPGVGVANRPAFDGQRNNWALHAEVQVPVTEKFEATAALRHDRYSDFGDVQTGKLGFKWAPEKAWMFRGSWGTGFRAPTLGQMVPSKSLVTEVEVPNTTTNERIPMYTMGNPDLKPERSEQWMLGLRWEPTAQWTLGADFWNLDIHDTFGNLPGRMILLDPLLSAKYFANGAISSPNLNLGRSSSQGVDYDIQWRKPTDWGRLRMSLRGMHVMKSQRQAYEGGEMDSNLGRYSSATGTVMARNQWAMSVMLEKSMLAAGATLNYRSGNTEQATLYDIDGKSMNYEHSVADDWTVDVFGRWQIKPALFLNVGIKNITNRMPPFRMKTLNVLNGVDTRYGDYYGRTLQLKIEYKF